MSKLKWAFAKMMKKLLQPPALNRCSIDKTARIYPACELTDTQVGRYTYLANRCFAVNARIGSFCSVADNCRIGGAPHMMSYVTTSPVICEGGNPLGRHFASLPQDGAALTTVEHDVWMGAGCMIKSGVTIHTGAVIGMGSVVTHDVPPYEIWAGNPAKKIRDRFDEHPLGTGIHRGESASDGKNAVV